MFPHRGTSSSLLQLSFLSLLAIVEAFKLSNPPTTFLGDSLKVSWTVSPNDPQDFDLQVGFCNNSNGTLFEQPAIAMRASSFRHAIISSPGPSGLELPTACFVRALDSETGSLLDSNPVRLTSMGFTSIPTSVPTAAVLSAFTNTSVTTGATVASVSFVPSSHSSPVSSHQTTVLSEFASAITIFPSTTIVTTSEANLSVSKAVTSINSESTAVATPTSTANQSSLASEDSKRSVGSLVGEVLGGVFAFTMLLCLLIALCIWRRRRHRRQLRNKYPFFSDETYIGHITQLENRIAAGEMVGIRNSQLNQQSMDLVTRDRMVNTVRGDPGEDSRTGTGNETGLKGQALKSTDTVSHEGSRNPFKMRNN